MKFRVTMKSPNCLEDSISEAVNDASLDWDNVSKEDIEDEIYNQTEEFKELCKKWFKYGELITVEIDTEAKTCVVVEV
jgi:hypothetical protein